MFKFNGFLLFTRAKTWKYVNFGVVRLGQNKREYLYRETQIRKSQN